MLAEPLYQCAARRGGVAELELETKQTGVCSFCQIGYCSKLGTVAQIAYRLVSRSGAKTTNYSYRCRKYLSVNTLEARSQTDRDAIRLRRLSVFSTARRKSRRQANYGTDSNCIPSVQRRFRAVLLVDSPARTHYAARTGRACP
jgi:hypothetical protein